MESHEKNHFGMVSAQMNSAISSTTHEKAQKDSVSLSERIIMRTDNPPIPGARLGRDENGNPAWYVQDPLNNSKYNKLDVCS
jgi:hypothetical protein